jgi:outer membrane murein-binding lipoprotein Lpp
MKRRNEGFLVGLVLVYLLLLAGTCASRADYNHAAGIERELAGIRRALERGVCK